MSWAFSCAVAVGLPGAARDDVGSSPNRASAAALAVGVVVEATGGEEGLPNRAVLAGVGAAGATGGAVVAAGVQSAWLSSFGRRV